MKSAGAIQKNTEKRASHDVLFSLCENAADKLILLVLLGSVLLFILWPIACIALRSLRGADGGVSFAMFGTVLRQYGESLRNSVFVGVFTAVLSTILSLSAALVCATARGWKKTLCMIIMLVAMVSPPFVSSLAYIQLYGRRGWITYRLLHLSLNPYNRWGVILMQSISFVPLNAMFLSGILEKLDEGSLRSARDLGASGGAILRDIVLPLIRPATLVCLLLSFVRSLADFGTPIIIGGRFSTLAADIYLQVVGYSDLEKSSAMNMFLLIPSIIFFFIYRALMRRSDRLTDARRFPCESSTGTAMHVIPTELGLSLPHCGAMGWGMIALSTVFFVMIVLQYGCVFLSGFLKSTKGVCSFTLQYWDQLWRIGSSTMLRSVEYALIVSIAGTVFAMLFAYYMDRRRIIGRSLFDCLATLPYMLPGTCFGIGYILAFNHAPLKLTGTALIVLANMLFKQLPTSTKICTASLALLPEVQERSARDLGAGRLAVLRDVVFPALRPAFLSCFVYNFTSSMTTAGSIIFLIDAKRQLAVFKLFDAVYQGDYALASLIASVITVIVLLVEGLAYFIARKGENRRVSRT